MPSAFATPVTQMSQKKTKALPASPGRTLNSPARRLARAPADARQVNRSFARTDTRVRLGRRFALAASVAIVTSPRPPKSFLLSNELAEYLVAHGTPPDRVQERLIEDTAALGAVSGMQI